MTDSVEENSVDQEVAPIETEVVHETQEHSEPKIIQEQESAQEKNWKAMRIRQSELEKELRKKEEMLEKFMTMSLEKQKPAVIEEPEEPDDEFIPKGKVKSVAKRAVEPLEQRIKDLEAKLESKRQQDLLSSLKSKYADFDDVVNPESLALLEQTEPELAQSIVASGDPYKMGITAYKFLKATQDPAKIAQKNHSKEIDKKIAKNEKTVQSPMAYDKRPMAQAFKLTQAEKDKLYEEMTGYARMASSVPEMG